jgi:hypothetical protein
MKEQVAVYDETVTSILKNKLLNQGTRSKEFD